MSARDRAIFENVPFIMLLVNNNVCIKDINQAGLELFGTTKEKIVGQLCGELFNCINATRGAGCGWSPGCARCPVRGSVTHTFKKGKGLRNEAGRIVLYGLSGEELRDLLISTSLIKEKGEALVLLTLVDITEHKRTEDALQQSEARYRMLMENLQEGIWAIDRDANTTQKRRPADPYPDASRTVT